jgi:hypothetical protein
MKIFKALALGTFLAMALQGAANAKGKAKEPCSEDCCASCAACKGKPGAEGPCKVCHECKKACSCPKAEKPDAAK